MPKKSMIVVHHAGKGGERSTFATIKKNHVQNRGYRAVAYHRVVERTGAVKRGRRDRRAGAHTIGRDPEDTLLFNKKALGICVCGNFDQQQVKPEQWKALVTMLAKWCLKHSIEPNVTTIVGHRDVQAHKRARGGGFKDNTCPGQNLYDRLPELRAQVAAEVGLMRRFSNWDDADLELELHL